MQAVAISLALALLGPADAHPFGQQYYALRAEIGMGTDGPVVVVGGEVPIMVVLAEFRHFFRGVVRPGPAEDEAYLTRKLEELAQGLALRVDGQPAEGSWVALDDPRNGKSAEGSFTYFLRFEPSGPWDLAGDSATIELSMGAYQDRPLWMSAWAGIEGGAAGEAVSWMVAESSARDVIADAADRPEALSDASAWSQDPAMRELRVVYQRVSAGAPERARGGCQGW
jgi:hypothetical protein